MEYTDHHSTAAPPGSVITAVVGCIVLISSYGRIFVNGPTGSWATLDCWAILASEYESSSL